jgi:hypothetical protein
MKLNENSISHCFICRIVTAIILRGPGGQLVIAK